MTLLELVIIAHRCRSTHHYIAIDALQLLQVDGSEDWKNLILKHHTQLLKGAKAPDAEFKDFKNHVLHVHDGEWGGARDAAMEWYGKAVDALRLKKWDKAAYALGVLTHYYADPIQPFHTGQTEEEGAIHRALEWSIAKSRDTLKAMIDARGYPRLTAGREIGFVADMVLAGAQYSNPHYQTFIDHYNLDVGVKQPEKGLDQTLLDIISDLIAYATSGVALLFDRAIEEAGVKAPKVDLDLPGYLAALDIPIRKITKKMQDSNDRKTVEAMYAELQETGKVIKTLPADDKKIRAMHAQQVLRRPIEEIDAQPLKPLGTKHVPMEKAPRPVDYVLKVVPVPREEEPEAEAFIPSAEPAPEPVADSVWDVAPEPVEQPALAATETAPAIVADIISAPEPTAEPASIVDPEPVVEEVEAAAEPEPVLEEEPIEVAPEPEVIEAVEPPAPEPEPAPEAKVIEAPALEAANDEINVDDILEDVAIKSETAKAASEAEALKAEREQLTEASDVVDAPSIGPKTADRLKKIGIATIGDFMSADPIEMAQNTEPKYMSKKALKDWQDQTRLMLEAPGLRVLDSQILVGVGIRSKEDLANASAKTVLDAAMNFLDTPQGARYLWGSEAKLNDADVEQWIDFAKTAT